jgi:hypothetical protein
MLTFLVVWNPGSRRTQLQDFREDLKSLQKLRILDVSQNSISVIPEVFIIEVIYAFCLEVAHFCLFLQCWSF